MTIGADAARHLLVRPQIVVLIVGDEDRLGAELVMGFDHRHMASGAGDAAAARAGSLAMLADSYASDSSEEEEEEEELPEAPELPELPEHPHNGGGAEGDSPARLARRGKQVPDYAMMVGIKRRLPIPGGAVREAKTPRKS